MKVITAKLLHSQTAVMDFYWEHGTITVDKCVIVPKRPTTSGSIFHTNKMGPKTEPWGTPQETAATKDEK